MSEYSLILFVFLLLCVSRFLYSLTYAFGISSVFISKLPLAGRDGYIPVTEAEGRSLPTKVSLAYAFLAWSRAGRTPLISGRNEY